MVSLVSPAICVGVKDGILFPVNLCLEAMSGEVTSALCWGCSAPLCYTGMVEPLVCKGFVSPVLNPAALQGMLWGKLKVGLHFQQNEELFLPVDLCFLNLREQANQVPLLKLFIFLGHVSLVPSVQSPVQCLKCAFVTGNFMEMVLFLESLVEAVTIFCLLHAVSGPAFEMWGCWDCEQLCTGIKGGFRPTHAGASVALTSLWGRGWCFPFKVIGGW